MVEQACVFREIDGRDPEATHLLCVVGGTLAGCLRIFAPNGAEPAAGIGRIALSVHHRGSGLGHAMMHEAIRFCEDSFPGREVVLSAQNRLQSFYARHGFVSDGEIYLEDGIPHVDMRLPAV